MLNAFTVDVEEWFHICGVPELADPRAWTKLPSRVSCTTRRLLDLLGRVNVRATFFVLGWVAERHPELVAEIRSAGHEIGSHGYAHARAYDLGQDRFTSDLRASAAALRAAGIEGVSLFRAPEWSVNDRAPWALECLARSGYRIDSSRAPLRLVGNPAYCQYPHLLHTSAGPIVEVPPLVRSRFGERVPLGGGWGLRMSAPASVIAEIASRNALGQPVTVWVHPWELDPAPPRIRLPWRLHFAHYFRLADLESRLETILRAVPFGTVSAMVAASAIPLPTQISTATRRDTRVTA
jgi:peptidoglycan-N-acetylglucosamine deacetylase